MSGVGIDFGNVNCVVAVARRGGIDVLTNEVSNRATPCMVAFQGEQRHIGESAANFAMQNYKNTCTDLKCLLAVRAESEDAKIGADWVKNNLTAGPEGFLAAECTYGKEGNTSQFSYEALVGAMLSKLLSIASAEMKTEMTECVVSVPAYYTDIQKRALLDAAKIGNVKVLRLLSEHSAAALNYGIFRTKDLPEDKPIKVAFVDVGQQKTTVSIADFLKSGVKVLSVASDKLLGGRDWDNLLVHHFAKEFAEKYKLDVLSAARPTLRLRKECEKLKKVLSANPEAPLNIECLMEDTDVKGYMSRDAYQVMMEPLLQKLEDVCLEALKGAGLKDGSEITNVEVIGGGTRIPSVKNSIAKVFGKQVKTTLNADEAVARGCALMCAMMSPTLRVREYALSDASPYLLSVQRIQEDDMIEGDDITLLPLFGSTPCMKAVSLKHTGACRLILKSDKSEPIADYFVEAEKPGEEDPGKLKVKVKVNGNGIAGVHSAALLVEEEVEVPITEPGKTEEPKPAETKQDASKPAATEDTATPPADAEAPMPVDTAPGAESNHPTSQGDETPADKVPDAPTTKKVKKTRTIDLVVKRGLMNIGLTEASLTKAFEDEAQMKAADTYQRERADSLNALESYVYDSREKLDEYGKLKEFVTDDVRVQILEDLEVAEGWIYSEEAEEAAKSTFVEKKDALFAKIGPIQARYLESENRPVYIDRLKETILKYKEVIVPGVAKYEHLTEEDKSTVLKSCEGAMLWLTKESAEQDAMPKNVDPKLTTRMLEAKDQEVVSVCKPISEKPKPKVEPPKEAEKPKDDASKPAGGDSEAKDGDAKPAEAADESGDVEMKDADTDPKAADDAHVENGEEPNPTKSE
eukprot:CAMPEP_0113965926 /NCGR_PEP_ID=MMETSP0011_2-20120614/8034_1 /TAXON_ID=101924 /ORGANISM="Rhodosorus marinus" /LENGTH=862 /DNA_ID=CAMNT_0000978529 /DNA_START=94 /DNA_END=2682 /DNA_ORIENTATION=- /assembly_acc=CAM_ASM_000156